MGNSVSPPGISIHTLGVNASVLFSYPLDRFANYNQISKFLASYYPILVIALLIWITIGYLRNKDARHETRQPVKIYFIYWLTFISFYILRFLLTSFVQQSSLIRMLFFMDMYPIVLFFSMIIFLIHQFENRT
jgi:hypothetical protein